jgi:hypothetical protein
MFWNTETVCRPFGGRGRRKTDPLGGLSNFLYFMMFIIYFKNKYNALNFKLFFFELK